MSEHMTCPFRKQTKFENGSYIEYFAECNKRDCDFFVEYSETLRQQRPFEKCPIRKEYYCNHPQRLRVKRISENHFIYTDIKIGGETDYK